jgi:hypothetical protein
VQRRLQRARKALELLPSEPFYKVNSARLVLVDNEALLRDILEDEEYDMTAPLSRELCDWLEQESALLSAPHLCASEVHSAVDVSGQDGLRGFRLPRYGRASSRIVGIPREVIHKQLDAQLRSRSFGLWLDLKGSGLRPTRIPKCEEYATGLLPLDEALEEYLWSRILDIVMSHSGTSYRCLPIYGIIDLGFYFHDAAGNSRRAAVLIRRGHLRNAGSDLPIAFTREHLSCLTIELIIRNYGITSAAEHASKIVFDGCEIAIFSTTRHAVTATLKASDLDVEPERIAGAEIDQVNIQFGWSGLSSEIELVDTVHYKTARSFSRPLVSTVADRLGAWGGIILPDSADFVQPDEDISLDERECGWSVDSDGTPTKRTRLACRHIAQMIADGRFGKSETKSVLDELASRATAKLH